jgi:arginine-tRNA-protein transferase
MQIVFSEYHAEYTTYTFSYAVYCLQEHPEEIAEIYARGFLPYTGDLAIRDNIFYLARSVRIDLSRFKDSSENRRINRKAQELEMTLSVTEKSAIDLEAPDVVSFCTAYAAERFSGGNMKADRLRYVLERDTLTHILTFRSHDKILGYVFAFLDQDILHYWYAFFELAYLTSHSLGKWMMWRTVRWAKDQGLRYVYLGTCYGKKALYKVRDHKGAEFFDGIGWSPDIKLLKSLCTTDDIHPQRTYDLLKSPHLEETNIFRHFFS